jgi:hypothetical protein
MSYSDIQFVRAFNLMLTKLLEKKSSLSKEDIDMVYTTIMNTIRKTTNKSLELSTPKVDDISLSSEEEKGSYGIHKQTQVIFKKLGDEWVAYGMMMDGDTVLKLSVHDMVLCVGNGWRFLSKRCIATGLCTHSPYSVDE